QSLQRAGDCHGELSEPFARTAGERVVWAREGQLHWGAEGYLVQSRAGGRRYAVFGRDRRTATGDSAQAVATAPGTGVRATGRTQGPPRKCPGHCRDQPGPGSGGEGRPVSGGFVLSPERDHARTAAAPPAAARPASVGRTVPAFLQPAVRR